jgi:predicted amidophosphoribosyltransferase
MATFCTACGQPLSPEVKFCGQCGATYRRHPPTELRSSASQQKGSDPRYVLMPMR